MSNTTFTRNLRYLVVVGIGVSLAGFVLVVAYETGIGQSNNLKDQNEKMRIFEKIERSEEITLQVLENPDAPLRIIEAKAKEISSADLARLTGSTSSFERISSVPRLELKNVSGRTITEFMLFIRDPASKTMRTLNLQKVAIAPGETFAVKPAFFVESEKLTVVDSDGVTKTSSRPKVESAKYWIEFAGRDSFFVSIGIVIFDDGSRWMVKEGGGIQ